MNRATQLREYFPKYLSDDSLFTKMVTLGAPWTSEIGQDMDDAYFTMYSGIKNPSEFVTLHLNPGTEIANSLTIARIIYGIYGDNWIKLWEAFKTKYTPIDNYNVQEVVKRTGTEDRTIGKQTDSNSTLDENVTTTYGQKVDTTANAKSYTFGFNSPDAVPTGEQNEVGTEENSGQDTTKTTSSSTSESREDTTDNVNETEDIERTRQGNVGQNSYQDLLRQEFELWRWNFFTQVFEDVDKFLVLSVYSSCTNH